MPGAKLLEGPAAKKSRKTKPDSKGQHEMPGLDTPLGAACENMQIADSLLRRAEKQRESAMEELITQLKRANLTAVKFKGERFVYVPGRQGKDKIQIKHS